MLLQYQCLHMGTGHDLLLNSQFKSNTISVYSLKDASLLIQKTSSVFKKL